jgi:hypothetical protein
MVKAVRGIVLAGIGLGLVSAPTGAAERDLYSGLAYLRAGAQTRAEESLTRYREEEANPEIRRSVDRVLPLLKRPLSEEVREYIAANLEERVRVASRMRAERTPLSYWSRMFPVFP